MACAAAYECPSCGALVVVGPPDLVEAYGGTHVCTAKAVAEKRFADDPRLSLDDDAGDGRTFAEMLA